MAEGIIGSVGVSVVPDATDFWRRFEAATRPGAASAGRSEGRAVRTGMQTELERPVDVRVKANTNDVKQAKAEMNLLRDAIIFLGPATVPIAGVLTGAFLGAVPAVATLALGISGIAKEMKKGSLVGTQYGADLAALSAEGSKLQGIAAGGLLSGIDRALETSGPLFKEINGDVSVMATQLGNIVAGAGPALLSIFTALNPLFVTFGNLLSSGATKLEHWATSSSGIRSFVAYVQAELPTVVHSIGELVQFAGHLVQALAPLGHTILGGIGLLAGVLNSIPVGVLRVLVPLLVSAYAAFRAYAGINALLKPLNAALVAHAATVAATSAAVAKAATVEAEAVAAAAALEAQAVADAAAEVAATKANEARSIAIANAAIVESLDGTGSLFQAEAVAAGSAAAEITASWAGVPSLFATDSTLIAEASAEEATAFQLAAEAAALAAEEVVASAGTVAAATTAAADTVVAESRVAGLGFTSMLGPLGAVAIGVGLLAATLLGGTSGAEAAAKAQDSYTESLKQSTDALAKANIVQTDKNLSDAHAFDQIDKLKTGNTGLKLSYNDLALAVNGTKDQYDGVISKLKLLRDGNLDAEGSARRLSTGLDKQANDADSLIKTLALLRTGLDAQTKIQIALNEAQRQAAIVQDGGNAAVQHQADLLGITSDAYLAAQIAARKNTDQTNKQADAFRLANDGGSLLALTLDKLSGKKLGYQQALNQFQSQLTGLVQPAPTPGAGSGGVTNASNRHKIALDAETLAQQRYDAAVAKGKPAQIASAHLALERAQAAVTSSTLALSKAQSKTAGTSNALSTALVGMSAGAVENRGKLLNLVTGAEAAAKGYGDLHQSQEAARQKLIQLRAQLIEQAVSFGENRREVIAFIDSVLKIPPKSRGVQLEVNTAAARAEYKAFLAWMRTLGHVTVTAEMKANETKSATYRSQVPGTNAAGTDDWRGGLTWVGERGRELVDLPQHAKVIPHDRAMAGSRHVTINNYITRPADEPTSVSLPAVMRNAADSLAGVA